MILELILTIPRAYQINQVRFVYLFVKGIVLIDGNSKCREFNLWQFECITKIIFDYSCWFTSSQSNLSIHGLHGKSKEFIDSSNRLCFSDR